MRGWELWLTAAAGLGVVALAWVVMDRGLALLKPVALGLAHSVQIVWIGRKLIGRHVYFPVRTRDESGQVIRLRDSGPESDDVWLEVWSCRMVRFEPAGAPIIHPKDTLQQLGYWAMPVVLVRVTFWEEVYRDFGGKEIVVRWNIRNQRLDVTRGHEWNAVVSASAN